VDGTDTREIAKEETEAIREYMYKESEL